MRFSEFELDLSTGELRSNGEKTYLQDKPFQILSLLLQRPGQLVTREELVKQLWADGTFVDFDQSLNKAVNRLREALGDSAEHPKFIETLPRRGYRFIAEVDSSAEPEAISESISLGGHIAAQAEPQLPSAKRKDGSSQSAWRSRRSTKWILTAAPVAALIAVVWILLGFRSYRRPALAASDLVLVSDFVNTTGDPIFDGTLKQALTVKLAESPFFNLVPEFKVRDALALMGRPSQERVVPPVAQEVCERVGAKVVVSGSIVAVGEKYIIDLHGINCLTGADIAHDQKEASNRDNVLASLGEAIPPLRQRLGESVSSMQKFDTPIEDATTKSLAALKAYTTGDEQHSGAQKGGNGESFYKIAIDLDPDFAIAYARLGGIYANVGNAALADEFMTKAFQHREHVSEREKLYIASHYYADSTREVDKAIDTLQLWTQTYPHDWVPFNNLSGYATRAGRLELAITAGQEALHLNPGNLYPYSSLAIAYSRASRFAEADAVCQQAIKAHRDSGDLHAVLLNLAFVSGDEMGIQRERDWFTDHHDAGIASLEAWRAFALGQARQGRELFQRSRAVHLGPQDVPENARNGAAASTGTEAELELELGNLQAARTKAESALKLMPESVEAQSDAAFVFAALGDFARAKMLAKKLKQRFPSDTLLNNLTLPAIQAVMESKRKNYAAAIDALARSIPYDFGTPLGLPEGITLYQRGLAYLGSGSGPEAAAQFQKIIDNHGIVTGSALWPLAHLGLARANAREAQTATGTNADAARALARTGYQDFFSMWKNADSDVPTLKQAKAEYAKLQ